MKKRLISCAPLFLTLSLLLSFYVRETAADPATSTGALKDVVIGAVIPLSGTQAVYGEEAAKLFQLFSEEGGLVQGGIRFKFVVEDGKCGVGSAPITAAKKLILVDHARYIIAGCSGEVLQIAPFTQQKKVLLIGYISGHRDVKHAGDYVFRTFYDLGTIGSLMNEKLSELNLHRMAVLTEEVSFTLGIKEVLSDALKERIVAKEDYPLDSPDNRGMVTRAKQKGIDSVFINSAAPRSYVQIYNELRRIGFNGPIFSYYQAGNQEVLSSLGDTQDNVFYFSAPTPTGDAKSYLDMKERYMKRFGAEINSEFQLAVVYNAIQSIVDGVVAAGDDSTKVRDYLMSYSAPGATGQIEYDVNGDIKNVNLIMKKIERGKLAQ
jgi:branched-chain amino acid transport system substrate-binding protein